MSDEAFFRLFLAALRASGVSYIDTRDDIHHEKFSAAVERLREAQRRGDPVALCMPRGLVPSPITGRFREFDDALVNAQRGFTGAQNPFYPGADLILNEEQAVSELEALTKSERDLLLSLAQTFRDTCTPNEDVYA